MEVMHCCSFRSGGEGSRQMTLHSPFDIVVLQAPNSHPPALHSGW